MEQARLVCDFIEHGGDAAALRERFAKATSPGFDFDRDLVRVGLANQTTMLSGESLAIAEEVRRSIARRYGDAAGEHFRSFDTICSATQERQDAVVALLEEPPDLMVVVGGYNSSNTCNLARICAERVRTYHIADPECMRSAEEIRHRPVGAPSTTIGTEDITRGWLPPAGRIVVGLTAGASTPNNIVGEVIRKLEQFCDR
jgi:4-hydroxy-3-methylbut-2-en-1-yl diphosphate reductase